MKKIIIALVLAIFTVGAVDAQQQLSDKETKKIEKSAKKEAKQRAKEGYKSTPGVKSIEGQLIYKGKLETLTEDDGVTPKYIFGNGTTKGGTYNAAKLAAMEAAKLQIAESISSETAAIIGNTITNDAQAEISSEKVVANAKTKVAQKLGRMIPVIEMYRDIDGKKKEVTITIAYEYRIVKEMAEQVIRKELEQEAEKLGQDVDKLLNL